MPPFSHNLSAWAAACTYSSCPFRLHTVAFGARIGLASFKSCARPCRYFLSCRTLQWSRSVKSWTRRLTFGLWANLLLMNLGFRSFPIICSEDEELAFQTATCSMHFQDYYLMKKIDFLWLLWFTEVPGKTRVGMFSRNFGWDMLEISESHFLWKHVCNSSKKVSTGCCFIVLRYGGFWRWKIGFEHAIGLENNANQVPSSESQLFNLLVEYQHELSFKLSSKIDPQDPLRAKIDFPRFINKCLGRLLLM